MSYSSGDTQSKEYREATGGSGLIHFPFVKSGTGTGMLPIAIDCSDRQVIAIHAAVS